jgi:hypothetical protein
MLNRIFSTDSAKAIKAQGYGYINAIHYMAPASLSGVNLCPHSSAGCRALCLGWESGQASMVANDADLNSVRLSRISKAQRFMRDRANYMVDFVRSVETELARSVAAGKRLCVRPNGATDIRFERVPCRRSMNGGLGDIYASVMHAFPEVDFVDYTKNPRAFDRELPRNYHLTFSRSEDNEAVCLELLARGVNVAVVFAGDKPAMWHGFEVIDGDLHDLRQLDPRGPRGFVIALSPKGRKAKRDISGFVVRS